MFAVLMTLLHFWVSSEINFSKSEGEPPATPKSQLGNGDDFMKTAAEYRATAEECFKWADGTHRCWL